MANNFTQFSFAIPLDAPEQVAWATSVTEALATVDVYADSPPALPEALIDVLSGVDEWVGYSAEVDEDGLWIYAEESGTPEHVVPLVQAYLSRFDPEGYIGFEWADWCSKPRLDEFGGGSVFITATEARWMHSSYWLVEQTKAHQEKHG